ncbi:vacuolar protein 14 C-terminal Fig4p binding-domain-containing protein [Massariosphaeria phaeospora]|uniref:Vacuolar protein 14 C-terminal Fig4p binding-domain-containing protein n=1 Tax=Massariosphaeria phaeospora TaxID=100035 RepID=A0A7C8IF69_9PLEO|nr:vacuolar protein 14 C-terminal Fig4p binding-domain-containing protein [Massariosphaeria phaeospora]
MDINITKALNDKLYDKRKSGALELEGLIRDCLAAQDHDRIARIVHQLCHDYAYAVHQPHARNGGLIGLAAASIALGPEVARHLEEIVPPVLACFSDHDARVRYYACESMYNIAKVAKGEILVYFNQVFDALCKLAADAELSVKNGAELLDRLVKDIVAESAASYVSVLHTGSDFESKEVPEGRQVPVETVSTAFSLERFLPLLEERVNVTNAYTRTFLVGWITLLDSIPDLELVTYLPRFLGGLFRFLSDETQDVHTATQTALEKFLNEIKKISRVKRGIAESKKSQGEEGLKHSGSSLQSDPGGESDVDSVPRDPGESIDGKERRDDESVHSGSNEDAKSASGDGDWIPGQDVQVDHAQILDILVKFLSGPSDKEAENELQLTALRWIDSFFEICPEEIMPFVPRLLSHVLPTMSHDVDSVRQAANRVNVSLMRYIEALSDDNRNVDGTTGAQTQLSNPLATLSKDQAGVERRESNISNRLLKPVREQAQDVTSVDSKGSRTPTPAEDRAPSPRPVPELDYQAAVNALTLQFLNEHEATRVAAIAWLIMLHRMAPGKILSVEDGTFPALLKTLSDPSEAVVTRDLLLLSQISRNSDDSYFTSFMVNLLKLFCTDRRLLETRGNLIIRQLCMTLSAERIYRTMADCLEKDEDVEFASIMVQNLNNNLITAPELADLRRRLRNLDSKFQDGQSFFVSLFKSWCHNAVATFSLCLLAQAYEQAYHLLQIFADLEMTVIMLIQIDKLVQLLESPVFTCKEFHLSGLLEPERYPHLYKCLYGLLMLLPQSSAFAALKNRLNSVSAIGYLHIAPRTYVPSSNINHLRQKSSETGSPSSQQGPPVSSFERPNRLKARDEGGVKWTELLDKFKTIQERARRSQRPANLDEDGGMSPIQEKEKLIPDAPPKNPGLRPNSAASVNRPLPLPAGNQSQGHKSKSSLSNLGRFAGGVAGRKKK